MKNRLKRVFNIGLAGFMASLVMFLLIYVGSEVTDIAPFNVAPSYAFLYNLGIEESGYALLLHFGYGILWSYVLVYTYDDHLTIMKAIILAVVLWLFMMVVYSPLIGWGIFGFGYAHHLPADHPLFLEGTLSYILVTLFVHLIYGWVLGYISSKWLGRGYQK